MINEPQRRLQSVPGWVALGLVLAFSAQLLLHHYQVRNSAVARPLMNPPSQAIAQITSLDDPRFAALALMLWLQAFDYQPGVSLSFAELDYKRVVAWLKLILDLDPATQYPLLSAARVYGEVAHPQKQRVMLNFIAEEFEKNPTSRWPWLAHGVFIAKHRLKDEDFALELARRLSSHKNNLAIPGWASQMEIFVLEDMGELESAKILLGGLLDSGKITDEHEQWFLSKRLRDLEAKISEHKK